MPRREIRLAIFPRLFYLFCRKRTGSFGLNLSYWSTWVCRCQMGQISVGLLDRPQPVSHQESFIYQKAKIIRLKGNAAGGLAVEQGDELDRCRTPGPEIAHQE